MRSLGAQHGLYNTLDPLKLYQINRIISTWSDVVRLFSQAAFVKHSVITPVRFNHNSGKRSLQSSASKDIKFRAARSALKLWFVILEK